MKSIAGWRTLSLVSLMFLLQANLLNVWAQTTTGSILGAAHDSSGAVIPGVSISIKNVETGGVRNVTTDSSGAYEVLGMAAGTYDIQASFRGFSTQVRRGIPLTVGAAVTVHFTLAVSAVESKVLVTGELPQVEATTATVSGIVSENTIRELPLNGRDWLQLATLQAGVVGGLGQQSAGQLNSSRSNRGNGVNLYISGNRPTENVFLVDGLIVNDYANASPGSGLNVNLGVDAVREFAVLTSEYTAQYGMTSGGVVNAIYKSGTNEFHGSGFGFIRNSALDARNFFDGATVPPFQRYQYGGSIGGPIHKNKTFFFGSFEGVNQSLSISEVVFTLSPNARNGILVCPPSGNGGQAIPACAGGAATYKVAIAPSIVPYLKIFPLANGAISGDTAQFNFAGAETGHEYYAMGKIDHNLSSQTTLFGSFQWDTGDLAQPDQFNMKLIGSPSAHDNFIMGLQHSFRSNLLNIARIGFSRTYAGNSLDLSAINPIAADPSLGFLAGEPVGILNISSGVTVFQGGVGASGASVYHFTSYQASDDLSWIRGRHTVQLGAMFDRMDDNFLSENVPLGQWDYGSIASFLTNVPTDFTSDQPGTNYVRGLRTTVFGAYVQDGIRLRPNLTLNAGLRYETSTPVTDSQGRVANIATLTSTQIKLGGAFWDSNPTLKNFAPRVGVAWDPTGSGKTSIRAAFGIYDILPLPYLLINRTHSAPFYLQGNVNNPPASAFPSGGLALLTPGSERVSYVQSNPPRAYNQQWNLTIQRQVAPNVAVMIGYVGSHAVHVPMAVEDMDQVPLSAATALPNGVLQFPVPPGNNTNLVQRINPSFGRIQGTLWRDYGKYNGMLVSVEKRFSHGFSLQGHYTWSKSMDEGSVTFADNEYVNTAGPPYAFIPTLQKAVSDYDITHNVVINGMWEIPVPDSFRGVERTILGGWKLGGIFNAHTGMPFTARLNSDQAFVGNRRANTPTGAERPNLLDLPGCSTNAINPGQPSNYIKLECFSFPIAGQLGNLGRNTLRGPGLVDFDLSLFKNVAFSAERFKLQFRAEVFNILNRPNFGVQTTAIFNGQGNIVSNSGVLLPPTLTTSRQIQLGVKFLW